MNDTIQKVAEDIYQVEIPLKGNPLKAIYSYIVLGKEDGGKKSCHIIDTGFNSEACKTVLMAALENLGADLSKAKLVITHLHSDHSGLAAELNQSGTEILTGKIDGNMINQMTKAAYWTEFSQRAVMMDLKKDDVVFDNHPGYKYCPKKEIDFHPLSEGDTIQMGRYTFEVIDIPGHTPGHIALYDTRHRLLISGDHILDPITPNIAFWGFEWNILEVYFESLKKVRAMDIDLVLPSHRKLIHDHKSRIDALMGHHDERLEEIVSIISDWTTVRDTAAQMKWSLRATEWSEFPDPQKWFAAGEAMSHLEYLYCKGLAERRKQDGILEYRRV